MGELKSETLKFRGDSAYFLSPSQWRADWITIRLRCTYFPPENISRNLQWRPHQSVWGRLTRAHKGHIVDEQLIRYTQTEIFRSLNQTQILFHSMAQFFELVYRGLDLDLELEPLNIVENLVELVLNDAGQLDGVRPRIFGNTPTEFRLATHPDAEFEWIVLWSEPGYHALDYSDLPGDGGGGGENEPNIFNYPPPAPNTPPGDPEPGGPGDPGNGLSEPQFNLPPGDFDQPLAEGYTLRVDLVSDFDTINGPAGGAFSMFFVVQPPWTSPSLREVFTPGAGLNEEGFTEWFVEFSDAAGQEFSELASSISAAFGSGTVSIVNVE